MLLSNTSSPARTVATIHCRRSSAVRMHNTPQNTAQVRATYRAVAEQVKLQSGNPNGNGRRAYTRAQTLQWVP